MNTCEICKLLDFQSFIYRSDGIYPRNNDECSICHQVFSFCQSSDEKTYFMLEFQIQKSCLTPFAPIPQSDMKDQKLIEIKHKTSENTIHYNACQECLLKVQNKPFLCPKNISYCDRCRVELTDRNSCKISGYQDCCSSCGEDRWHLDLSGCY